MHYRPNRDWPNLFILQKAMNAMLAELRETPENKKSLNGPTKGKFWYKGSRPRSLSYLSSHPQPTAWNIVSKPRTKHHSKLMIHNPGIIVCCICCSVINIRKKKAKDNSRGEHCEQEGLHCDIVVRWFTDRGNCVCRNNRPV